MIGKEIVSFNHRIFGKLIKCNCWVVVVVGLHLLKHIIRTHCTVCTYISMSLTVSHFRLVFLIFFALLNAIQINNEQWTEQKILNKIFKLAKQIFSMSFHSHKAPSFIHCVALVSDLISIYIQRWLLLMLNFFEYKLGKSENSHRFKEMIRNIFFPFPFSFSRAQNS